MVNMQLVPGQHIHFVGIGGFGLSAIARILLEQGFFVSGSDQQVNELTHALVRDGATIYNGHNPAYVNDAEIVVVSSAIPEDHIEILSAQAQAIPIMKRQDIIAELMPGNRVIAIAGTHGKTTTTAITAHVLKETGKDPNYIVGGIMANTGTNAGVGKSDLFVIEADEYDNMFHGLEPDIEVVTNVEYDHPDFFRSARDMVDSFSQFIGLLPSDGHLIACVDNRTTEIFAKNRFIVSLPLTTYGVKNPSANWHARNIRIEDNLTVFDVFVREKLRGTAKLSLPGEHNILNSLAALIIADLHGVEFDKAVVALESFKGTNRRFQIRQEIEGVIVVDDYAHHPTAIRATLAAAKQRYPEHEIWAVWQPHTYSRLNALFDEFVASFNDADHVLVTQVYAARDQESVIGMNGEDAAKAIKHKDVQYMPDHDTAVRTLISNAHKPSVILIMSAGDATEIGKDYVAGLQGK